MNALGRYFLALSLLLSGCGGQYKSVQPIPDPIDAGRYRGSFLVTQGELEDPYFDQVPGAEVSLRSVDDGSEFSYVTNYIGTVPFDIPDGTYVVNIVPPPDSVKLGSVTDTLETGRSDNLFPYALPLRTNLADK